MNYSLLFGGIAQLGERLNGIQEVSGSIPLISTRKVRWMNRKHLKWKHFGCFSMHATHSLPSCFVTSCHIWGVTERYPQF